MEGKFIHVYDSHVSCDWLWGIEYKEWDTKEEVMEWMLDIQLGRRNLTSGALIYANSMVAEEIALENKEKVSKAVSESNRNRNLNPNSVQMDGNENKEKNHILLLLTLVNKLQKCQV